MNKKICPSRSELTGYANGTLPPTAADEVTQHIAGCASCEDTLENLGQSGDGLLRQIQAKLEQERYIEELACRKAISYIEGKGPSAKSAVSATAASSSSAPAASERGKTMNRNEFVEFVTSTGLISSDEFTATLKGRSAAETVDAPALAKTLVQLEKLTKYQAAAIYQGKGKSLFYGDYLVLDRIGAGGMGQVFKARHRRMDRIVALKVMSPAAIKDADSVRRFEREVRAAAKLTHPNVVHAYDAGAQDEARYLVMEYVEGCDLSALMKQHPKLGIKQTCHFIEQAARGFAAAHAKGIVHRDVKPGNLLIDKTGVVKVLDMGLARFDDEGIGGAMPEGELTQSGSVMGTVDYMAPEQALDTRHADAKSDVYGLGCTFYRALAGEPVFGGRTLVEKILAHRESPVPSLRKLRPDAPPQLDLLLQRMMAKNPADRPTMQEVAAALATIDPNAKAGPLEMPITPTNSGGLPSPTGSNSSLMPASTLGPPQSAPTQQVGGYGVAPSFPAGWSSAGAPQMPRPRTASAAPPRKRSTLPLLAAAGAGGLLLLAGIWVYIKDKDGRNIAAVEVPEGGSVEMSPSGPAPTAPPPPAATLPPNLSPASAAVTPNLVSSTPPTSPQTALPASAVTTGAGALVCNKIDARAGAVGLASGAVAFSGPPARGTIGGKGFLLDAPSEWKKSGTTWDFEYRPVVGDEGVVLIHPYRDGHTRISLNFNSLGQGFGGPWGTSGAKTYDTENGRPLSREVAPLFPLSLRVNQAYRVISRVDKDGVHTLHINGVQAMHWGMSHIANLAAQEMKPPFTDANLPTVLPAGKAGFIIAEGGAQGDIAALDIRFSNGEPAAAQVASATPGSLPSPIQVTTPFPLKTVTPEELISINAMPSFLKGYTALVSIGAAGEANADRGKLSFTVLRDGPLYMATSWAYDGRLDAALQSQVMPEDRFPQMGWIPIAKTRIREIVTPPRATPIEYENTIFYRNCKAGETYTLRTRKYNPPMFFFSDMPSPHAAMVASASPAGPPIGIPAAAPILCTKLIARGEPVGLTEDAVRIIGPRGDGRSGGNGFIVKAPADWRTAGTEWQFMYRCNPWDEGILMIHPLRNGHVRIALKNDRMGIMPGGPWGVEGVYSYAVPQGSKVEPLANTVLPLQQVREYRIVSRCDSVGNYTLSINTQVVLRQKIDAVSPQQMKPPFEDPNCPDVIAIGDAALVIGPAAAPGAGVTIFNEANDVRLSTAGADAGPPNDFASPADGWTPLIPLVQEGRDTQEASWKVNGETAQFGASKARAVVWFPYQVESNYDADFRIKITRAKETTALTLPVGEEQYVVLDMKGDGGNSESPSATVKLKGLKQDATPTGDPKINIGTEYRFTTRVRTAQANVSVEVDRDGQPLFRWIGTTGDLNGKSDKFRPKTLQLETAYYTNSEIRELRARPNRAGIPAFATSAAVGIPAAVADAPKEVTPAQERGAAMALLSRGAMIRVSADGRDGDRITTPQQLPNGPFKIVECSFLPPNRATDQDLLPLRFARELREVDLQLDGITDEGLVALAGLPKLWSVALTKTSVRGSGLRHLIGCEKLQRLIFTDHSVGVSALEWLPQLKAVGQIVSLRGPMSDLSFSGRMKSLSALNLDGCDVTDLRSLRGATNINALGLRNTYVIDSDLAALQGFPNLSDLDLANTDVTDAGMDLIRDLPRLNRITLTDTYVTEAGAGKLRAKFPNVNVVLKTKAGSPPSPRRMPQLRTPTSGPAPSPGLPSPSIAFLPTTTSSLSRAKERKPTPSTTDQDAAQKLVHETFKDEYAAAKTPEQKVTLAAKLIDQARQTLDDPASHYVLLTEARELAIEGVSLEVLNDALNILADEFSFDAPTTRLDAWNALLKRPRVDTATIQQLARIAGSMFDQATVDAEFDLGKRYGDFALAVTRRLPNSGPAVKAVTERNAALAARQKEWPALLAAVEKLKTSPDDAEANLLLARYHALAADDWPAAFPHYAKCGEDALRAPAENSVAALAGAVQPAAAGDVWWDAAQALKPPQKQEFSAAADYWYRKAAPLLSGISRTRIQKRIDEMEPQLPLRKIFPTTLPLSESAKPSEATPGNDRVMPNRSFGERS